MTSFSSIVDLSEDSDQETSLLRELDLITSQETVKARLIEKLARLKQKVSDYQSRIYTLKSQSAVRPGLLDSLLASNDQINHAQRVQRVQRDLEPIRNTPEALKLLGSLHGLVIDSLEAKLENNIEITHFAGHCGDIIFLLYGTIHPDSIHIQVPAWVQSEIEFFLQTAPRPTILYGLSQYSLLAISRHRVFKQLADTFLTDHWQRSPTLQFSAHGNIHLGLVWTIHLDENGDATSRISLTAPTLDDNHLHQLQRIFYSALKDQGAYLATCIVHKLLHS